MSEKLSQNEIDILLSELTDEDIINIGSVKNQKNIKEYDFKSPKRISKDQIKMLTSIYENFSRHLASYLSSILRMYCEIKVDSIEELPYFEYNNALPDTMITGIFDLKPIEGSVMLDLSNNITYSILERVLGGNIENSLTQTKDFTDIDIALIERVFKKVSAYIEEAWSNYLETNAALQQIETNTRLIQSLGMDEVVVIITMIVSIKSITGNITCCIPCLDLEEVLDKLSSLHTSKRETDSTHNAKTKEQILSKINNSLIEVCGVLGNASLSLNDVLNLQVGDVIKLERRVDNDIEILVNGNKWYAGIPGIKHNKKALKVNKVV